MISRLLPSLVLAAVACVGTAASAQAWPGECVTRRATGPGDAYRGDRVECEPHAGRSDFDRWGYERRPLEVVDGPLVGDRYGGWRQASPERAYSDRDEAPSQDDRFDTAYPIFRVAGRDADGFLVWPGKLP
jgi:hypothetical protein